MGTGAWDYAEDTMHAMHNYMGHLANSIYLHVWSGLQVTWMMKKSLMTGLSPMHRCEAEDEK